MDRLFHEWLNNWPLVDKTFEGKEMIDTVEPLYQGPPKYGHPFIQDVDTTYCPTYIEYWYIQNYLWNKDTSSSRTPPVVPAT